MESAIELELYKSLRAEARSYVEKVPGLWLQKLTVLGAVIGFLLTQPFSVPSSGNTLRITAVAVLPALAIIIDAKMLEYALHARAISRFIAEHFSENATVAAWERAIWGESGSASVMRLTHARSAVTWFVTVFPTVVTLQGATLVIRHALQNDRWIVFGIVILGIAYVAATAWGAFLVYRLAPEHSAHPVVTLGR